MEIGDSPLDFSFSGSLSDAVNFGVALAILLGGGISIFYIFFGGIQFITSGGDEEKAKTAVKTIRYAIIGLLVIIFAVTFVAIIGALFNIELTSAIRWDNMKNTIQAIINKFSGGSTLLEEKPEFYIDDIRIDNNTTIPLVE